MMGPVIETIMAGCTMVLDPKAKDVNCRRCDTPWPCDRIKSARASQVRYAKKLKHKQHQEMSVLGSK